MINNCRYIDCNATDTSPDGGTMLIWDNEELIQLSNCLFSICNSGKYGGAIDHSLSHYQSERYPIRYCFFKNNTGIYGNDIYIAFLPSDDVCLHCYSNSESHRVGYWNNTYASSTDSNWLPQTPITINFYYSCVLVRLAQQ